MGQLKNEIVKKTREIYSDYLYNRVEETKNGKYGSWIMNEEKRNMACIRINNFLKKVVKARSFSPIFKPRASISPIDWSTLRGRRLADFMMFVRLGEHDLRILVNEKFPT